MNEYHPRWYETSDLLCRGSTYGNGTCGAGDSMSAPTAVLGSCTHMHAGQLLIYVHE